MNSKLLQGTVAVQMRWLPDGTRTSEKAIVKALSKLTGMFGDVPRQELRRAVHQEFATWRRTNGVPS